MSEHAPAQARALVQGMWTNVSQDAKDRALLLVSEVVTNAVEHGPDHGSITVAVEIGPLGLGCAVSDAGERLPEGREVGESSESGRGLYLLAQLAQRWGVRPATEPPGKTVWFYLAAPIA